MERISRGLLTLGLAALAAFAGTAQAQVVISQVYGGGGNSGATWQNDFVELHNNGSSAASLAGLSLQYAASTGVNWSALPLSGSIPAGGYYLVRLAGGTTGAPLPAHDATGSLNLSGTAGKIALLATTTALPAGTVCPATSVDLVGFGAATNCAEARPTPNLGNALAARRLDDGCRDTDVNADDFEVVAPAPRNSASPVRPCGTAPERVLRIADAAVAEGDSGTRILAFGLTLSGPAGEDGVRFSFSTRDITATAPDDYVAAVGVAGLIPAGSDRAEVRITINGDLEPEADETFELRLDDVTGARPESTTAIGTILNDDFAIVPIAQIQGPGEESPLVGQLVATRGIVTGRRSNGFFIQSRDIDADADENTSEGLFVFTSSAPPEFVQPGRWVVARGRVVEFAGAPGERPLTELANGVTVTPVDDAFYPLPAPVVLSPTFPSPAGALDQLERVEGMRVTAPEFLVVSPTAGFTNETQATGSTNGIFHVVVGGVARPFREPGLEVEPPAGSDPSVPRWDLNPELISVDSDALIGAPALELSAGTRLAGLVGPLTFGFGRYQLLRDPQAPVEAIAPVSPRAAKPAPEGAFSVAAYNLERFFDTVNDPRIGGPVLSAAAFERRLSKASIGIRDYLHAPDILGVVEMENIETLRTLAARISSDAVAAGQPDPRYSAHLVEGNDVGGIDVGFLVRTADTGAGTPRIEVREVVQVGKDTTWTEPGGGTGLLNDRPPLLLDAVVHYADGRAFPLDVVVVHQRSLNGANTFDAAGERVRAKRQRQAEFLAGFLDARQNAAPDVRLVVLGDFNAFEFNDGLAHIMGTVTGQPAANEATIVPGDGADLVEPDLVNLGSLEPPSERYSFVFGGNAQTLDHVLVNEAMVVATRTIAVDHARINADFPETMRNDAGSPARLADHDPVVAYFVPRGRADLAVDARAPAQAHAGGTLRFEVDLANAGPDPADRPAIGFDLDVEAADLAIAAPAGWGCDAPAAAGGRTLLTCSAALLAPDATARFDLHVPATAGRLGRSIGLVAAAEAESIDPDPSNNADDARATVVSFVDLAASLAGPGTHLRRGAIGLYRAQVANLGPDLAVAPVLTLRGDAPAANVELDAPQGWTCSVVDAAGGFRARCGAGELEAGADATVEARIVAPLRRGAPHFGVHAQVTSRSVDGEAANDDAHHQLVLTGPAK